MSKNKKCIMIVFIAFVLVIADVGIGFSISRSLQGKSYAAVTNGQDNELLEIKNIEFDSVDLENYATITAYGEHDNIVWKYETPQYEPTELPRVSEIGQKNDRYYFIQDSTVVALDTQQGTVVWENSDFGGSGTDVAFGENAIYLCGQYGPDFYAVSYDGITLSRIEQFDPDYYWASRIELIDKQVAVYLHGGTDDYNNPKVFYVDLETYEVKDQSIDTELRSTDIISTLAGDWTDGNIEYRFFADKTFEHNIVFFSGGEVIYRSNVQKGVVEVTGVNTADLDSYVQQDVLQTSVELIYDSQADTIYIDNRTYPYYRENIWINEEIPKAPDVMTSSMMERLKDGNNITGTITDGNSRVSGGKKWKIENSLILSTSGMLSISRLLWALWKMKKQQ